jgi:lipase
VEDVLETLDALNIQRTDVLGFSFGGCISIHLAAAAPERVDRLVLLEPAILLDGDSVLEGVEEELVDWSWGSPEEALAERMLDRPPQALEAYREDFARRLERGEDGRYRIPYSRGAVITAYSELSRPLPSLATFSGSVLLVTGRRSPVVGEVQHSWINREVGSQLSAAELDCNHMLYFEAFEDMARVVSDFLGETSPSSDHWLRHDLS